MEDYFQFVLKVFYIKSPRLYPIFPMFLIRSLKLPLKLPLISLLATFALPDIRQNICGLYIRCLYMRDMRDMKNIREIPNRISDLWGRKSWRVHHPGKVPDSEFGIHCALIVRSNIKEPAVSEVPAEGTGIIRG